MDEQLLVFGGMGATLAFILSPAAVMLWMTRRKMRVTVLDASGKPAAGARVVAHITRSFGGRVGPGDVVIDRTTEQAERGIGRTGPDGVLDTWLLLTNPWGLYAVGADGTRSPQKVLKHHEPGQLEKVTLRLQGAPKP